MTAYIEHTITLRITRAADGSSPADWDWPDLIDEAEVEVVTCSGRYFDREEVDGGDPQDAQADARHPVD